MSKYQPLADRLAARSGPEWRATFAELEKALGFGLPKAARAKAWWKEGVWKAAGWTAELDTDAGNVTFRKTDAEPVVEVPAVVEAEPPILKRLEVGPGWGVAIVLGGVAIVAGIGALAFRGLRRKA